MHITLDNTIFDLQQKLLLHIYNRDELLNNITILLEGITNLNIPLLYTEQYPHGSGKTVNEVRNLLTNANYFVKNTFSCCGIPKFVYAIKSNSVIISGIVTHVCVLQTAIDLLEKRFLPVIIDNSVSLHNKNEKKITIKRIISEGGIISNVASLFFVLIKSSEHPNLKNIKTY